MYIYNLLNRALLCKTLPLDVGRCTCLIVKEQSPEGLRDGSVYSLYTHVSVTYISDLV